MDQFQYAGHYNAYFWVLCTEKYFKVCNIPETEKMSLAVTAMSGCALKWQRWWSPCHPGVSWIVVPRVWFNFFDLII
jgi:hypothetical protein